MSVVAETARLVLRTWRPDDADAFAAMNADPTVTAYVGGPLDRAASDALLARIVAFWAEHGYGRAAVEERSSGVLLGWVGLGAHPLTDGEIEIGWRLVASAWGRGYATEAAVVMRDLAFASYGLPGIVSIARRDNVASVAVMRKIGMRYRRDVPWDGPPLVMYELLRPSAAAP